MHRKNVNSIFITASRSNSMGANMTTWPSQIFGSEIADMGEFPITPATTAISDPSTPDYNYMRHMSAPTKKIDDGVVDYSREISPPCTAPPKVVLYGRHLQKSGKVDILHVNHGDESSYENSYMDDSSELPGTMSGLSPPTSKSEGDLLKSVSNQLAANNVSNSHSDTNFKQQQQCCATFGTTAAKHRNHANGCALL